MPWILTVQSSAVNSLVNSNLNINHTCFGVNSLDTISSPLCLPNPNTHKYQWLEADNPLCCRKEVVLLGTEKMCLHQGKIMGWN